MKREANRFHVQFHWDGDYVVFTHWPLWAKALEAVVASKVPSWAAGRWTWAYLPWNWLLNLCNQSTTEVWKVPADGCEASSQLYGEPCWRDRCPTCTTWHASSRGRHA